MPEFLLHKNNVFDHFADGLPQVSCVVEHFFRPAKLCGKLCINWSGLGLLVNG